MMIAIIDYGVGNLFSLSSSLKYLGLECEVTADRGKIKAADKIILPGVGAFADAYNKLCSTGLADLIKEEARGGKPLLGICLGMQLLFDESFEYGRCRGLSLIEGSICPLEDDLREAGFNYKVPHIGWNSLDIRRKENPLMKYSRDGDFVYYVHSFYAKGCDDSIVAASEYGVDVIGAAACGNVFGCQFHPEKSGSAGLRILRSFAEI